MENQSERGWCAGVIGSGRGLTGVSLRLVCWAVSDSLRQLLTKSGRYRLFGVMDRTCLNLLPVAAETNRQIIQKVTVSWRSGSALSTRSGSNDFIHS